jgi:disulfide oxidoreductase YuzD
MNIKSGQKKNDEVIEVIFDQGKVLIETSGFEGKSCTEATEWIEEALGAKNQKKKFKSEYYKTDKKLRAGTITA